MGEEILLNYLGKAYFHQDFDLDAETPEALVKRFAYEEDVDYVQIMADELGPIMASSPTETAARHLWLVDAHSMYDPARDGKTYLAWLHEILDIVQEALRTRPADEEDDE